MLFSYHFASYIPSHRIQTCALRVSSSVLNRSKNPESIIGEISDLIIDLKSIFKPDLLNVISYVHGLGSPLTLTSPKNVKYATRGYAPFCLIHAFILEYISYYKGQVAPEPWQSSSNTLYITW